MNLVLIIIPVIYVVYLLLKSKSSLKAADVKDILARGGKIIDVRSTSEYKSNHVNNAKNIEHTKILAGLKKAKISKETPLILYCASGARSSAACSILKSEGFTEIHNGGTVYKVQKLLSV